MELRDFLVWALAAGLASCGPQRQPAEATNNSAAPVLPAPSAPPAVVNSAPPEQEPSKATIDPRSAEAAAQVVQRYGALVEQGRWTESWTHWSNPLAAKQFDRNWRNDSEVHMETSKPGEMEGAAGSSYVTVSVTFYGKDKKGAAFRRPADVIVRRVNDVPGSTEAQRRWHIERIDWRNAS